MRALDADSARKNNDLKKNWEPFSMRIKETMGHGASRVNISLDWCRWNQLGSKRLFGGLCMKAIHRIDGADR